ncbi:MAG: endonuclease/exonuclease/phosphatase family protein [Patescibacteria group bacterium]
MPLWFGSLNIDCRNNLRDVDRFLQETRCDLVCLQEVFEIDLMRWRDLFPHQQFAPMTIHRRPEGLLTIGVAILARAELSLQREAPFYYLANSSFVLPLDSTTPESRRKTEGRVLVSCTITKEGMVYRVGTTHFTWVPDGKPDDHQRRDARKLLEHLALREEFILCGDFNTPRGGEIWAEITRWGADAVPKECDTSIDPERHRVSGLRTLVDGIWSRGPYLVSNVRMQFGVSDHAALMGSVTRIL